MTREESYKETKVCPCVCCGKDVTVTKFASAAKVMCDECKTSGATPNPELVASAAKAKRTASRSAYGSDTKVCKCIKCGRDVTVTKFASAAKVICDECRGVNSDDGTISGVNEVNYQPKINLGKIDRTVIPDIKEYTVTPALFNNAALRHVKCPACGHDDMKILKVFDWSVFGLIIHYQCPKCKLLMSVSEQTKHMVRYRTDVDQFDYSGEAISAGISATAGARMSMACMKLIKLCQDNNITIEGDELPPYLFDEDRPVPVGYRIPNGDTTIKAIDDAIKLLMDTPREGTLLDTPEGSRYITISDTKAKAIVAALKGLLEEEQ